MEGHHENIPKAFANPWPCGGALGSNGSCAMQDHPKIVSASYRVLTMAPTMPTWMRVHRGGLTAMVAKMWGYVYVSYTSDSTGAVSMQGDDDSLEIAQACADSGSGCLQPCTCQAWSQIGLAQQTGALNDPKKPQTLTSPSAGPSSSPKT